MEQVILDHFHFDSQLIENRNESRSDEHYIPLDVLEECCSLVSLFNSYPNFVYCFDDGIFLSSGRSGYIEKMIRCDYLGDEKHYETFVNDMVEGVGYHHLTDKTIWGMGKFRNALKVGIWKSYWINGNTYSIRNYVNGNLEGTLRFWLKNGTPTSSSEYQNGELEGLSKSWHRNGVLGEETMFHLGLKEGISKTWDAKGNLIAEVNYVNGEIV